MTLLYLLLSGPVQAESPATAQARALLHAVAPDGQEVTSRSKRPWWSAVDDPTLHALIQEGMRHSPDLAAADAQVRLAEAGRAQSLAGLLPTLSVELQGQVMPTDGISLSPYSSSMPDYGAAFEGLAELMASLAELTGQDPSTLPSLEVESTELPDTYGQGSAMLVGTLPIDIAGRQVHGYLASRHSATGAVMDQAALRMTLSLRIAQGWYDLVAARKQADIVGRQVQANKDMRELVRIRYEGGEATALDLLQQRQQLAATEALLPRARAQVVAAQQALAVSMGKPPGTEIPAGDSLPELGAAPATGTPDRLLVDRPDLSASVARLDAARLQRTGAVLGLAPTLGVTGSAGRQFLRIEDTDHVDTWSVGAALSVPLFGGGRTHAGIKAATAQRDLAEAQLRSRVLAVAQEVQTAGAEERESAATLAAAGRQHAAARAAYVESRARYLEGLIPYVNVLAALVSHQVAELSLLDAQRSRLRARVRLHGALGGPWVHQPLLEDTP